MVQDWAVPDEQVKQKHKGQDGVLFPRHVVSCLLPCDVCVCMVANQAREAETEYRTLIGGRMMTTCLVDTLTCLFLS